jgi:hypothetical protein
MSDTIALHFSHTGNMPVINNNNQRSSQVASNLERSPKQDEASNSTKNLIIGLLTISGLMAGAIWGYRKLAPAAVSKQVDKFDELLKDIPYVQKEFKNIFLNKNLTEDETINTINRYRALEKMRLDKKVSKEDYIKAVFEEAKNNYGLAQSGIKLQFNSQKLPKGQIGKWSPKERTILINLSATTEQAFGAVHHELRHSKQSITMAQNCPPEFAYECALKSMYKKKLKEHPLTTKPFVQWRQKLETPEWKNRAMTEVIMPMLNSWQDVPKIDFPNVVEYAKNVISSNLNYVQYEKNQEKYWINWIEQDARYAEHKICKLFKINEKLIDIRKESDNKCIKSDTNFDNF